MNPIPYGHQDINEEDIRAVVEVLKSDFITQGPKIDAFEKAIAAYCGARYAVAVCNATAALHLACLALDLKSGERLWTSPNSFVASSNCGLYVGAGVDFVDIDSETYNMSTQALESKLIQAQRDGNPPRVVVAVHHSGQSCDMKEIQGLSIKYGFKIIEDASHAVGGSYKGKKIGSCEFSDMAVFSFHPVKIITSGEGGMILTNNEELYKRLLRLRTHGITRDAAVMTEKSHGPWYYQQIDLGFNYRMTDLQAALGMSQLKRINGFVARRHEIAKRYDEALRGLPLQLPVTHPDCQSALHLYVVRLKLERSGKTQKQVFEELHKRGVMVNLHYIPIHLQPYYQKLGFKRGDFPKAERYYEGAISLPMYAGLTEADQNRVIEELIEVLR